MKDNKIECFIATFEGIIYVIPIEFRDEFDGTPYHEREKRFGNYILPDEGILDSVLVEEYDMENIIDGWF